MSKDFVVTLEVDTDLPMMAIVTCQADDFNENKITHVLLFDIFKTQKRGEIWLRSKMTINQFNKWSDNWKVKSVEGNSLTDFMKVIAPVVRAEKDEFETADN